MASTVQRLQGEINAEKREREAVENELREAAQRNAELHARIQVLEQEVGQSEARCMGALSSLEKESHGRVAAEAELAMAKRELMKMPGVVPAAL